MRQVLSLPLVAIRKARRVVNVAIWNVRQSVAAVVRRAPATPPGRWLRELFWRHYLASAASRAARGPRPDRPRLYWGPDPIINFKYWSDAMRGAGFESATVVSHEFENFKAQRFDLHHDEIFERSSLPAFLKRDSREYVVFLHVLQSYDILHIPFTGGPLGTTPLADREPKLLEAAGIKTVIVAYGGDVLRYSTISDAQMRHAMLINYPDAGREQAQVDARVARWSRYGDVVVGGLALEGMGRWDVLTTNYISLPEGRVQPRESWGSADGSAEPVRIVHAPNHRGVKGTEFIVDAVEALVKKGLAIDFVLLEGVPNEEVLEAMRSADICVDQCMGSAYGLFAIEAMATGSTVTANLEDRKLLDVHRNFAWLSQCPIVSVDVERLEQTFEHLVRNPELREELGRAGIEYAQRFHSPETSRHLFGSIYRKLAGEDVDLMRLFHPISSEYMQRFEPLRPPLHLNRLPEEAGTED